MAHNAMRVSPDAEVVTKQQALMVNIQAARGLQMVLKTNLGPRGTLKMLVGGAGQIKITKDGAVLLYEMQIQHPTACLVARTATAQDDITGDGTTSVVLLCGELLKQAARWVEEGLHPRVITAGYDLAKQHALEFLDGFKKQVEVGDGKVDRETLVATARTSLYTKLQPELADLLVEATVDAVLCVRQKDEPIDLHMVEVMTMKHKQGTDSRFVRGIVTDHGARHPDMPTSMANCHVLTCNVSLEYEKSELASGFFYSNAGEREKMVESERKFTDDKVKQVIALKRQVCKEGETFLLINQKGIDPLSLDMLAKEGIMALRRCKRRNQERLTLACGGQAVNSFDDVVPADLGYCGKVSEVTLGDDKYCFVEETRNPTSCTILLKGANDHTIAQLKDAVRDGLRAVKNVIDDECVIPGAGAFEAACAVSLLKFKDTVEGKAKLGVQAFSDALLIIPKTLAENSGMDVADSVIKVQDAYIKNGNVAVGLDLITGETLSPEAEGIWDNYRVKRQFLHLSTVLATQLLLVDEVMKAGKRMGGGGGTNPDDEV